MYYHLNFIHVVPIIHELLAALAREIQFLLNLVVDYAVCHVQEQNFGGNCNGHETVAGQLHFCGLTILLYRMRRQKQCSVSLLRL